MAAVAKSLKVRIASRAMAAAPGRVDPSSDHPAPPPDQHEVCRARHEAGLYINRASSCASRFENRLSAPIAAGKEALAARDIISTDDHVLPPAPLAPEALRAVLDELISELEGVRA